MSENSTFGLRMLDFDDAAAGILAYAVGEGRITEDDADPIWKRFDDAKANGSKVRIYAEMHAMPSSSGAVIVDKLKHLGSILSTLDRFAVVGDAGWMGIYAKIVDPITKFEVKHFTLEQRDAAIAWVRE